MAVRWRICRSLKPIAIQQIAQATQDTAFFAAAAELGAVLDDAAGQPADRQRLQPDLARATHQGKEETQGAALLGGCGASPKMV
jgi:hypothetical protein